MLTQERPIPRNFVAGETHYVWGQPCSLYVEEGPAAPGTPAVALHDSTLTLRVRPGSDASARRATLDVWYRHILRVAAEPRMAHWQTTLGLPPVCLRLRRMKTRWGTCTPGRRTVLLNTALAEYPPECLEYLVVHELTHFHALNHGPAFTKRMDAYLPQWREIKKKLNRLPVSHGAWQPDEQDESADV